MLGASLGFLMISVAAAPALLDDDPAPASSDRSLEQVERRIGGLPKLKSERPLYGLFLFGAEGEKQVWAVLDESAEGGGYDVLHLDLDADGVFGERGEVIAAEEGGAAQRTRFVIDEIIDPATGARHENFRLIWTAKRVSYKLQWRGEAVTMGLYGPNGQSYGNFADSVEAAPIIVPGWDRPFAFEHWVSGVLTRGETKQFKVFVGNRGSSTGLFSTVDDEFLPPGEYPVATLIYADSDGKEQRYQVKLTERC